MDKVTEAQHRIEALWNETGGKCYVSFSGGKDSTVLLALVKLCQDLGTVGDIPAVFSNTGIEMGVTVDFVRWVKANWYPNVVMIRPEHSFDWILKNKGKPMVSKLKSEMIGRVQERGFTENLYRSLIIGVSKKGIRAYSTVLADKYMHMISEQFPIHASSLCCKILKKKPFEKFAKDNEMRGCAYGIREGEGGAREKNIERAKAEGRKICTFIDKKGFIKKAPLVDWTEYDVNQFVKDYDVPLSKAYTEYGFKRTGCMGCPYALDVASNLKYLYFHEPNRYKASMHWLKDVYIAQNVKLPFDEAYERERERENVAEPIRTDASGDASEVQTAVSLDQGRRTVEPVRIGD